MSETPVRKNRQLSTSVSPELHAALTDYRFANKIDKLGEVLTQAVTEFVENHKIPVPAAGDTKTGK